MAVRRCGHMVLTMAFAYLHVFAEPIVELCETNLLQRDLVLRTDAESALRSGANNSAFFVWHTDAHVDPFYLTDLRECQKRNLTLLEAHPFGIMSCDPPERLLRSAFAASARIGAPNASFVLYTGDFVRHAIRQMPDPYENASQIVANVSRAAKEAFEDLPVLFGTLGNSDSREDYYQELTDNESSNPWFEKLGSAIHSQGGMKPEVLEQFTYGSYYETREGQLTILSLATVIYSVDHLPYGPLEKDPFGQFRWLRQRLQLAAADGRHVWIVGHISPGIETFAYTELWYPQYVEAYLEIVQDPVLGPWIAAQLFGHVHKDELRLLPEPPASAGPIFLSSSLSPVYYNNPSFKLVEYDPISGRLLNLQTFISDRFEAPEADWIFGYDHLKQYGLAGLSMAELQNFTERLLEGGESYERYASWYASGYPNELEHYSLKAANWNATWKWQRRRQYVCALVIRTAEDFENCSGTQVLRSWQLPFMERFDRLILGRLWSWAQGSSLPLAQQIKHLAAANQWEELLRLFKGLVEWSLQSGTPLESALLTA
ncbi:unnamed protein product [Durusdinium trenchii]|uniref:Sphingomyelin phosphodiesterase n=3 Tax=Durusdinium trenchii TaxID=1381693 RepID=A0ABP0RJQ8_9DINO